jgi:ectoine hydroxylase-related dioxygenase (phytanoyl-CoA dioxygenase family)
MSTATLQEKAPSSALRTEMTPEERYLFDLQGYLVVPNALSPDQLCELNAIMDRRIADEVEPDATQHRFYSPESLLSWGGAYRELLDNPRVLPHITELVGPHPRFDHDYADIIRSGHSPIGASLHGGGAPFDECCFYAHKDGRIRCGLMVVAYNLHDVNPGDGGFGAVPGSHKANFPFPQQWKGLDERHPCVTPVTGPAGTAIIFSEAMTHGALPWRGRHERRTLFYKYSPGSISWAANYYDADDFPGLTDRQRAMLEAPNARYAHRVVPKRI